MAGWKKFFKSKERGVTDSILELLSALISYEDISEKQEKQ